MARNVKRAAIVSAFCGLVTATAWASIILAILYDGPASFKVDAPILVLTFWSIVSNCAIGWFVSNLIYDD